MWITLLLSILAFQVDAYASRSHSHVSKKLVKEASRVIEEAMVKVPTSDEVCFAPEEPCDVKLWKLAQSANQTLDIAIFDINLDKLVHEILIASKKVSVRMVVDRRQAKSDHSLVPTLIKGGVKVKYGRQRGIMHNKFMIVDGKMLELGSFNYTNGAAFKNNENQLYLANPAIVTKYKARFEKLWSEGDLAE